MDLLQVSGNRIVKAQGEPIQLRGTCIGGWMNMENFINGYPGSEHGLRATFVQILGEGKARFFFDRLLDYFLGEDDLRFIKECGANVVRLPLNYRHFELDSEPFKYLESGFARLDQMLKWCGVAGLYAILDLHAVQGWQNTDWHSDNSSRHALFWQDRHYQDRFVALWQEFARRYAGNHNIAGYNLMNEPVTNAPRGRFSDNYTPDWSIINSIYHRAVKAIRQIDPEHIIFLEGDYFSSRFEGLEQPFAENLVYSSHNYTAAGFGPGPYPGNFGGQHWDRTYQQRFFSERQGTQFARKYRVPLWIGEFGSVYNGPAEEEGVRLLALDDQLDTFEEFGAHWTTWTYKDVGVMGWVSLDQDSEYMRLIAPVLEAKRLLHTDFWMGWLPATLATEMVGNLAREIEKTIGSPDIVPQSNQRYLTQAALDCYAGMLLQPSYVEKFQKMSEADIDRVLQSFAFSNCKPRRGLVDVIRKYTIIENANGSF